MKAHLLYRITNSLTDLSWRIPAPVLNGSLKVCESQTDSQNFKKKLLLPHKFRHKQSINHVVEV